MFYQKLRSLREKDGISQSRFAQEIGFSQAAISAWENNTREPGIEALIQIAKYFNISVDYLVKESDNPFTKQEKTVEPSDSKEILKLFNGLPKEYRAQVLEYTRFIAERVNATKRKNY